MILYIYNKYTNFINALKLKILVPNNINNATNTNTQKELLLTQQTLHA